MHNAQSGLPLAHHYNAFLLKLIRSGINKLETWKYLVNRRLFAHRDDDIFIATYMKSGTTLLQMAVYQLLSDGDTSFDHIYDVSPFIDEAIMAGASIQGYSSPRILKTHGHYRFFPKNFKGKIIYCIRNGMDVAVSRYYHLKNYYEPGMEWDVYFDQIFLQKDELWFHHVAQWLENKNKFNIHYVHYEELTSNMRASILGIAEFLGRTPGEETLKRVLDHCSFAYMKAHQHKFGERPDRCVYDQFIRKGESDKGVEYLKDEQKERYYGLYEQYLGKYNLSYHAEQFAPLGRTANPREELVQ